MGVVMSNNVFFAILFFFGLAQSQSIQKKLTEKKWKKKNREKLYENESW